MGLPQARQNGRLTNAIQELLAARQYAIDAQRDAWDFAVEMERLEQFGTTEADLRWLTCKGYVEHAREISQLGDDSRCFRPTGALLFAKRTCFVLTEQGTHFAERLAADAASFPSELPSHSTVSPTPANNNGAHRERPHWDAESRELRLAAKLVKRFKWSAINQETILAAFQEENWPVRIDDPLPPHPDQDSRRRLSDTIKCLNRKQTNELIRFRGDGTGEGIVWEVIRSPIECKNSGTPLS